MTFCKHRNFNTIDVAVFANTEETCCIARQRELLTIHNTEKKNDLSMLISISNSSGFLGIQTRAPEWKLTKRATKPHEKTLIPIYKKNMNMTIDYILITGLLALD